MDRSSSLPVVPQETSQAPARPGREPRGWQWPWIISIGVLLILSGGGRYWRDQQFRSLTQESEKSPFPLAEFPKTLGGWQAVEGSDGQLEPEIARIAGSSDNFMRAYTNDQTGETVSVMVLYGLALRVFGHNPEICYPAAGYRRLPAPDRNVTITTPDGKVKALFYKQQFGKVKAGISVEQEVYHSYRNAGLWEPDMAKNWKAFRYHPGMFKVQVQRQIIGTGSDPANVQQLIGRIVQELEDRLGATS